MGRSRRLFRGDGDLQIVEPLQQSGDRDAALQSRQVMAEAIVVARSEGQMLVRCAGEVQCVGVGENRLLSIGGDARGLIRPIDKPDRFERTEGCTDLSARSHSAGTRHTTSSWRCLENELLNTRRWTTTIELAAAMADYIDNFYNVERRHSYLGNISPTEFETLWTSNYSIPQLA
jgi:transposase InsO family protein